MRPGFFIGERKVAPILTKLHDCVYLDTPQWYVVRANTDLLPDVSKLNDESIVYLSLQAKERETQVPFARLLKQVPPVPEEIYVLQDPLKKAQYIGKLKQRPTGENETAG